MTHRLRRPLLAIALATVVTCACLLGSVVSSDAAGTSGPMVRVDLSGLNVRGPYSAGWLPVAVDVLSANGGTLRDGPGLSGRFPSFDPAVRGSRAVVRVRSLGGRDSLSPGRDDFRLGVAFRLDEKSEGGAYDNGNNLVQRGLFADSGQYKLQVEHGHVSCRVKGSTGEVLVVSATKVTPLSWYGASCVRSGDTVTLSVEDKATARTDLTSATTAVGKVAMGSRSVPMSIGGKLNADGAITTGASDQMNGLVRHVTFQTW